MNDKCNIENRTCAAMNKEPNHGTHLDADSSVLPYWIRLIFVVLIPNLIAWIGLGVYIYQKGMLDHFRGIAGPSGPGPGSGNGFTLILALVVFILGAFMVFSGVLIPIFLLTMTTSIRKFRSYGTAFLGGIVSAVAGTTPAVIVYLLFKYNII